jgi:hypothetical protein
MHAKAVLCAAAGALAFLAVAGAPSPAAAHWDRGPYAWGPAPYRPHWRPEPWRPHVWQPPARHYGPPPGYRYGPPPPRHGQYGFAGPYGTWR